MLGPAQRRTDTRAHAHTPQQPSRRGVITSIALPALLAPARHARAEGQLSIDEVESRLRTCFEEGQYYVSGKLDRGIFEPDCLFTDPTIRVKGAPAPSPLVLPTAERPIHAA